MTINSNPPKYARKTLRALAIASSALVSISSAVTAQEVGESSFSLTSTVLAHSTGYSQVGAYTAQLNAANAFGSGVVVGVLDTGINLTAQEFSGRILPGYNVIGGTSVADDNGHGSNVAGLLAGSAPSGVGSAMQGVASQAQILPVKVLSSAGTGTAAQLAAGINDTVGRAKIINLSLNLTTDAPAIVTALQNAVTHNMLVVVSAGNLAGTNPIYPAIYGTQAWANGQIIAVGSVDAKNGLSWFSNAAGTDAAHYLVAPGESAYGVGAVGQTFNTLTGTSQAAPIVAGAAAVVWGYWPKLTAAQVAAILTSTATDLGPKGMDAYYGMGQVNLVNALKPLGTVTVASTTAPVTATTSVPSTANAAAVIKIASLGGFQTEGLDSYGRNYTYDLGHAVKVSHPSRVFDLMDDVGRRMNVIEQNFGDVKITSLEVGSSLTDLGFPQYDTQPHKGVVVHGNFSQGSYSFGSGALAQTYFGLTAVPATNLKTGGTLLNPYLGLVADSAHAGVGFDVSDHLTVKFGFLSNALPIQARSLGDQTVTPHASMGLSEIDYKWSGGMLAVSYGVLTEMASDLGSYGSGALALNTNPTTDVITISAAQSLDDGWWFGGSTSVGYTRGFSNINSMITGQSGSASLSGSVAAVKQAVFTGNDIVSFGATLPMRTMSGTMNVATTTADSQGNLYTGTHKYSLAPTATEVDVEAAYSLKLSAGDKVNASVMYRVNPDHDSTVANEFAVGVTYKVVF